MAFGPREARRIADPVVEPVWSGQRVLLEIAGGRVAIRDEGGDELQGYADLRDALTTSLRATEVIVDGYLLPAPLHGSLGAEAPVGMDSTLTPAELGRQMFLGGGGRNPRREAIELAQARRVVVPPSSPTAFVAIDLLWLDGESLLEVPLLERKRLLESVLAEGELVRLTMTVRPPIESWYAQWKALGFREVAVKAANSRYTPGEASDHWATQAIPRR
jgi:ATP-dependent DNA ligase